MNQLKSRGDIDLLPAQAIKLCADAMGEAWVIHKGGGAKYYDPHYNPLENDAQAFALQARFKLCILKIDGKPYTVWPHNKFHQGAGCDDNLRVAIVECVARQELYRQSMLPDPRITNYQFPPGTDMFGPEMCKEIAKNMTGSQK